MTAPVENKDIIHLQHSHVTQYANDGVKGDWLVRKNITSENLAKLPGHLSEADVFTIMDFAKKFELLAFNEGIGLGKEKTVKVYQEMIDKMNENLAIARAENERLAGILEKHIGAKE